MCALQYSLAVRQELAGASCAGFSGVEQVNQQGNYGEASSEGKN